MRYLLASLAILAGACAPSPDYPAPPDARALAAMLVSDDGDAFCAGSWVGRDLVLTAAHCIGDWDVNVAYWRGRQHTPVRVQCLDLVSDVAILRTPEYHHHSWLPVGPRWSVDDDPEVETIGAPLGRAWTHSAGERLGIDSKLRRLHMDLDVNPGSSGGGVTDSLGRLIGVVIQRAFTSMGSFAIAAEVPGDFETCQR